MSLLPLTWSKGAVLVRVRNVLRTGLAMQLAALRAAYAADDLLSTIQPPDPDVSEIVVAPLAVQDQHRQQYPTVRVQPAGGASVERQANGIGIATWAVNIHVLVTAAATDDYDAQEAMVLHAHAYLDAFVATFDATGGLSCADHGVYAWDEDARDVAPISTAETGAVTAMLGTLTITLQQYTPR